MFGEITGEPTATALSADIASCSLLLTDRRVAGGELVAVHNSIAERAGISITFAGPLPVEFARPPCCSVSSFHGSIGGWFRAPVGWPLPTPEIVVRWDDSMTAYRGASMGGPPSKAFLLRQVTPVAYFD